MAARSHKDLRVRVARRRPFIRHATRSGPSVWTPHGGRGCEQKRFGTGRLRPRRIRRAPRLGSSFTLSLNDELRPGWRLGPGDRGRGLRVQVDGRWGCLWRLSLKTRTGRRRHRRHVLAGPTREDSRRRSRGCVERNCDTWCGADIRRREGSLVVSGRSFLSNDAAKEVGWDDLEEHITWWLRFFPSSINADSWK